MERIYISCGEYIMSIFKTYSPQTLWSATSTLLNVLFHRPPRLPTAPASYFADIKRAHKWIKDDLQGIFEEVELESNDVTIGQIHLSLKELEQMLFCSESKFEATIEGSQLHTESLILRLRSKNSCVLL